MATALLVSNFKCLQVSREGPGAVSSTFPPRRSVRTRLKALRKVPEHAVRRPESAVALSDSSAAITPEALCCRDAPGPAEHAAGPAQASSFC